MKRQEDRAGSAPIPWLSGGGVMGEAIQGIDWAGSPLGPIDRWPATLRTALGICLALPAPACVAWGSGRVQLYNDAYARLSLIFRSPVLGTDFAHTWAQAWPSLARCFDRASRGEAARLEGQQVTFESEEGEQGANVTFCFAPIYDDSDDVGGVMITLLESGDARLREELARTQSDMAQYGNVISHDFRAPLRTLEQIAALLASNHSQDLPDGAVRLINHVSNGAAKLAQRAEAMTRMDALARHPLHRQRIDVTAMVNKIVEEQRRAAGQREMEVVVGELPEATADYELLRMVFVNLLSNAFKFTRKAQHARIEVSGRKQEHHLVYAIKDNGVGFDPRYARRLFGFFQRMHTEAEFEGLGMGLAVARRLVERHGGTMWLDAETDRGAEVRFTLPA
jgi:signal transduction histidine kinase